MADTEIGKMTVYKDDEGDSVLKVYGKLQTDKKLDTEAQTIVEAINELKKLSGEGGGEADWTMPAHWLDIPDPAPGEVILYAEIDEKSINCPISSIQFYRSNLYPGGTIDWGDGWVDTIPEGKGYFCSHVYSKSGQYIIKIAPNDGVTVNMSETYADYLFNHEQSSIITNLKQDNILAFKIGSDIILTQSADLNHFKSLIYAEFCGKNALNIDNDTYGDYKIKFNVPSIECIKLSKLTLLVPQYFCQNTYSLKKIIGLPEIIPNIAFMNCHGLREMDLTGIKTLGSGAFTTCCGLKKVYAPDLTSIQNTFGSDIGKLSNAFTYCYNLEEFYAPKLAEISGDEFYRCYSLKKLTLADGCNLNGNTFNYCPLLYPKPKN